MKNPEQKTTPQDYFDLIKKGKLKDLPKEAITKTLLEYKGERGEGIAHWAAFHGQLAELKEKVRNSGFDEFKWYIWHVINEQDNKQKTVIDWAVNNRTAHLLPEYLLNNKKVATTMYIEGKGTYKEKHRSLMTYALEHLDKAPHLAKILTTDILMSNQYGDQLPIERIVKNGFLKFLPKDLFTKELVERNYNGAILGEFEESIYSTNNTNLVFHASIHDDLHNIPKEFLTKKTLETISQDGRTALQNMIGLKFCCEQDSETGEVIYAEDFPCDNSHKFPDHLINEKSLLLSNFGGKCTLDHLLDIYNNDYCQAIKVDEEYNTNESLEVTTKIKRILKKLSLATLDSIRIERKNEHIISLINQESNKKEIIEKVKGSESLEI